MAALEEPFHQTLLLRYFDDLSAAEIARRLHVPAGTVRWRLSTARDLLRADLDVAAPNGAVTGLSSCSQPFPWCRLPCCPPSPPRHQPASPPSHPRRRSGHPRHRHRRRWLAHRLHPPPDPPRSAASGPVAEVPGASPPPGRAGAEQVPGTSPAAEVALLELAGAERGEGGTPVRERLRSRLSSSRPRSCRPSWRPRIAGSSSTKGWTFTPWHGRCSSTFAPRGSNRVVPGITQQLAKLSLGPERTLARKLRQVAIAHELERRYTKQGDLVLLLRTPSSWGTAPLGYRRPRVAISTRMSPSLMSANACSWPASRTRPHAVHPSNVRRPPALGATVSSSRWSRQVP